MGDPYLNSGESFIITTHRISTGFAQYDMMLTSRHLVLVDSSSARFEPNKIPLTEILSVTAGRVASGEPVITLAFTQDSKVKDQEPKNLLFAQQPGEKRKRERDLWIRKLMEQIVIVRQQEASGSGQSSAREATPRPPGSTAHTIEFALPHKSVVGGEPAAVELKVEPDEISEVVDESPMQAAIPPDVLPVGGHAEPDLKEPQVSPDETPESPEYEKPATTGECAAPAEVLESPSDSSLPEAPAEPVPVGGMRHNDVDLAPQRKAGLFERLVSAVRMRGGEYSSVPEDPVPHDGEPATVPHLQAMPAAFPDEEPEPPVPLAEILETMRQEPPFTEEPVPKEVAACTPQLAPELPSAIEEGLSAAAAIPPVAQEQDIPAGVEGGQALPGGMDDGEKTAAALTEHSEPGPSKELHLFRLGPVTSAPAIIALILILLALAGGGLVFLQWQASTNPNPVPAPGTPTATSPLVMDTPHIPDPHEGVWVLVTSNGSYIGMVGNPGNLQHIGGTGVKVVKIVDSNGFVQASFEKQDYTGAELTVEVFRNGTLIYERSVSSPRGSFDFIIDAKTGAFPGGIPTPTSATGLIPGETYRY